MSDDLRERVARWVRANDSRLGLPLTEEESLVIADRALPLIRTERAAVWEEMIRAVQAPNFPMEFWKFLEWLRARAEEERRHG